MEFSLKSYLTFGSTYCVIEHSTSPDGGTKISCLEAIKRKGEFEINKIFRINTISELSNRLKKNQHCYLILNNNQVLLKNTSTSGQDKKIIGAAFPNIDISEFYYQILKTGNQNFVAICRKKHVHELINSFQNEKLSIIGFSLSFFSIEYIKELLKKDRLYASNYLIHLKENSITSVDKINPEEIKMSYNISDTNIDSIFLLILAGLFNYNNEIPSSVSNFDDKNTALEKEHQQQVFFRKGLFTGTGILLFALIINFFLFSSFYSEYQKIMDLYQVELSKKQIFDQKKMRIKKKEKLVSNLFINSNSKSSFYLNRIISHKPASIQFQELIYQPLKNPIQHEEQIQFEENKIIIHGESKNEIIFSEWVKDLEKMVWLSEVKVTGFSFKSKEISEFSLILNIIDNETID